ncbi:MAG: sugar ABC transporter ATP-binding protein [Actinobacteria bacterium]|nr:sugar ABC transporter ATP-binding protein [Actinomycetota bacterium]
MTTDNGKNATLLEQARGASQTGATVVVEHVDKRFGVVRALQDVSVTIRAGTIHALVGENGAGKSTLGKVMAGVHAPDSGQLIVDGRPRRYRSPRDSLADGVTIVAQEVILVPLRSVEENVFLGHPPARLGQIDRRRLREQYEELVERAGFALPPDALVAELRLADQQKVEILRGLARGARLIVMDEPTAALTRDEAEQLFGITRALRERGTTIVYVSHFLKEVLELADTITVLRDGRVIDTAPAGEETESGLVSKMIGRSLDRAFPPRRPVPADAPEVLRVRGVSAGGAIHDVSFEVRAGEVLGFAGLVGSGRSELAHAVIGAMRRTAGTIELDGQVVTPRSPADAKRLGIALLPESRKTQGLVLGRSITENVTLPHLADFSTWGAISPRRERRAVEEIAARLDVRTRSIGAPVRDLSGGNQQKVLFAKWLLRPPRVLIADEPTRGVDVGAKRAIYDLIVALAAEGMAIVLISSELEEVLSLSHRVCVMRAGRLDATLSGDEIDEERVVAAAFGSEPAGAQA